MDPFTQLVLIIVTMSSFFLLLAYALHRVHGISLKRQWQVFKALNRRIGAGMLAVFHEEQQGRNDRRVLDQYDALCQAASGADSGLRIMGELRRTDAGVSEWVTPRSLGEMSAERTKAVMALRVFLGQMTPEQSTSIARATADECLYQIDVHALHEFLRQESDAADDASEAEIILHYYRFRALIDRLYLVSCQDGKNRL